MNEVEKYIYVIGGKSDKGFIMKVEKIDILNLKSEYLGILTKGRDNPSSMLVGGELYVFGG
jgi:hypothetical protein